MSVFLSYQRILNLFILKLKKLPLYRRNKGCHCSLPGASVLEDDVAHQIYPRAVNAVGRKETFVGRFEKTFLILKNGVHMWIVSDNLLKGASALNSVQIAETLHERGFVRPTEELVYVLNKVN